MDRIEFVVAWMELGLGREECAEPVINDERLHDLVMRAGDSKLGYAGLPPILLHRELAALAPGAEVLRCSCGELGCSWVRVTVESRPDEVVWHTVRASHGRAEGHAALGPYRFDRAQYERALAAIAG